LLQLDDSVNNIALGNGYKGKKTFESQLAGDGVHWSIPYKSDASQEYWKNVKLQGRETGDYLGQIFGAGDKG
jgi:hypothetical protein